MLYRRVYPPIPIYNNILSPLPPLSHPTQYYQQQKNTLFGNFHAYRTGKSPLQWSSPAPPSTPQKMFPITARKRIFFSRSSCYFWRRVHHCCEDFTDIASKTLDEYIIAVKILQIWLTKLSTSTQLL